MGMQSTTTNLTYARNDYIKQGRSHIFDRVGDMLYYFVRNNDVTVVHELTMEADIGTATPADHEGIKGEFEYGVAPSAVTGNGKMVHGLDIKMIMDQDWDFDLKPYNATVRGARIQAYSEDDISGRLEGAYINAQAQGTSKTIEGYISGATGPGIIGIEARTELATSASITTPSAVGVLIFHQCKANADLTGMYRGLQVEVPLILAGGSITSTTYAMYVGNDWGGADTFDYGLYIKSGTCTDGIYVALSDASGGTYGVRVVHALTSTAAVACRAVSGEVTYTPATAASGGSVPIGVSGKVQLAGSCASDLYMWAIQGQLDFASASTLSCSQVAAIRAVMTNTGNTTWTSGNITCLYCDNLIDDDIAGVDSSLLRLANNGGTVKSVISTHYAKCTNFVNFETAPNAMVVDVTGGGVHGGTIYKIKCELNGSTYYMLMSTAPTT